MAPGFGQLRGACIGRLDMDEMVGQGNSGLS
jgi:hypothetical protein